MKHQEHIQVEVTRDFDAEIASALERLLQNPLEKKISLAHGGFIVEEDSKEAKEMLDDPALTILPKVEHLGKKYLVFV